MPDPITPLATPNALWSRAKADFLEGVTADEACRRYGLSRSRFFERAKAEGWRRADRLPACDDEDEAEIDAEAPLPSARTLADRAWRRATRALSRGRLPEAQGWTRLARDLRRLAVEETGASCWRRLLETAPADGPQAAAVTQAPSPAPTAPAVPAAPPLRMADVPAEFLGDPDATIAWIARAMDWPDLLATTRFADAPQSGEESGAKTDAETAACPAKPDFPDSPPEFDAASDSELAQEVARELGSGTAEGAPDPARDPEGWAAWAALCDEMRRKRPDEAFWGEADPAFRPPPDPSPTG